MSRVIQTITMKVKGSENSDTALKTLKKLKKGLAKHDIGLSVHYAIEAGPASGYATISYSFPSAVKWAELVDSKNKSLQALRQEMIANSSDIVSSSLLQEVEL